MNCTGFFFYKLALLALKRIDGPEEDHDVDSWAIECLELRSTAYEHQNRHGCAYRDCQTILAIAPVCRLLYFLCFIF